MQVPVVMQKKLFDITVLWIVLQFNITVLSMQFVAAGILAERQLSQSVRCFSSFFQNTLTRKQLQIKYWPESYFIISKQKFEL